MLQLDMLQLIQAGRFARLDQVLVRLVFQTVVYHVWRERNARRHNRGIQGTEQMISIVNKTIKNRISSLKYKADHKLSGLMCRWFEVFD